MVAPWGNWERGMLMAEQLESDEADTVVVENISPWLKFAVSATLFLTYMAYAMAWQAGDHYIRSLGFTTSETALLTNAITLAQVVGSLAAANVMLKLGPRKAFTLASLLIVFGGVLSLASTYPVVFFIRFVLGLGGALAVVYLSAIVARILTGRALQVANGVNSVAFNTGLAVALTFAAEMAGAPITAILVCATISTVLLAAWLVLARRVPKAEAIAEVEDASYTMRHGLGEWFNWVFALAYTGLLSYYIVAFTFMNASTVRWVVYAGVIGALSGTVVAARVSDRVKMIIVVTSAAFQLVFAALVLAFADTPSEVLVSVLLGLAIFFPMPSFVQMAFMRPDVTARQISVTFSIFWAVSYAGSVVFIQVFAWIADATGGLSEHHVPVSPIPMVFIVIVEGTFLIGTIMLARHLTRVSRAAELGLVAQSGGAQ